MSTLPKFRFGSLTMGPRSVLFDGNPVAGVWVQGTEGVCGGATRIRNTRYTVWGLVEWRQLGLSDDDILERHPDLSREDLTTAWAYYERNRQKVDQAIRENQEA